MDKLKWVDSAGGPLILISDKTVRLWSGILNRNAYLINIEEEAKNFLNPDETDYGKACLFSHYLGIIKIDNDDVLVLGDEPMLTSFFLISEKPFLIRWVYAENKTFVENALMNIDLNSIDNWKLEFTFTVIDDKQFLFDAACSYSMISKGQQDYLQTTIKSGNYMISTAVYMPDDKTKLILYKFEKTI